jgi:glycosyltransferase involved in cell wall biosynthesis
VIRVLHIITRLDVGGSTENTLISATRIPRGEFASALVSGPSEAPPPGLTETLRAARVHRFELPTLARPVRIPGDMRALRDLWRLIRALRPDIVHTHSSKAGFLGRMAARLAGVPHIVHTPHGHVFQGYFSPGTTRAFAALERLAARWTDRIVTLTDAEADQHRALGIGRAAQFVTIPSGVDLETVERAAPARVVPDGRVIGCVGRLVPIKGHCHLLDAAPGILAGCPEARFLLVGDGELRPTLEAQARMLGVADRVVFTGFREDVPALLAGMDIVVLPSLNEGMGRVLVMAMALGKPVVASRVGGVPELLQEGAAGCLVPPGDSSALAETLRGLLLNPARAKAMGETGRRRAARYGARAMVEALTQLYREVAGC